MALSWTKVLSLIFRDYVTDGVPASGANEPDKEDIRVWGGEAEGFLDDHETRIAALEAASVDPIVPQGRLTLITATPVMNADAANKSNIFYTPHVGALAPYYTGSAWGEASFSELTLPLDSNSGHTGYHQSGKNYDLFLYRDSNTWYFGSGPAWASDTSRGTGAGTTEWEWFGGLRTNKYSLTLRYGANSGDTVTVAAYRGILLGSFRCSADGQTTWVAQPAAAAGGGACKLFLSNLFHRAPVVAYSRDSTDSWTYTTATWRAANAGATGSGLNNSAAFLRCIDELPIDAGFSEDSANSSSNINRAVGIGLDSASSPHAACDIGVTSGGTGHMTARARLSLLPGLGYHYVQALEWSTASGTTTWYGDNGGGAPPTAQMLTLQIAA